MGIGLLIMNQIGIMIVTSTPSLSIATNLDHDEPHMEVLEQGYRNACYAALFLGNYRVD
jgi:hypothetical protein